MLCREPLEFFTQYPRSGTLSDSQSFDDTDPSHYKRIYYEKERVAHIINVIVLGLSALVFACESVMTFFALWTI